MVANLDFVNTLADRLDDTTTLVSKDDGEGSLRIVTGECVGITIRAKAKYNN